MLFNWLARIFPRAPAETKMTVPASKSALACPCNQYPTPDSTCINDQSDGPGNHSFPGKIENFLMVR